MTDQEAFERCGSWIIDHKPNFMTHVNDPWLDFFNIISDSPFTLTIKYSVLKQNKHFMDTLLYFATRDKHINSVFVTDNNDQLNNYIFNNVVNIHNGDQETQTATQ